MTTKIRQCDIETSLPIQSAFFQRHAPVVARDILGKILVTESQGFLCAAMIVEVEAYLDFEDPASHAFRGKTRRNASMFGAGGLAYVYLSYGMHRCVNIVTGKEGTGEAVLLRAAEPLYGLEAMAQRRNIPFADTPKVKRSLASGPGKLTAAMNIQLSDDGRAWNLDAFKVVDLGIAINPSEIETLPRIGISKGVELPLRFLVKGSPFLSRA